MAKITDEQLQLVANTIRCLAADGVQAANSGHPGLPMGMADVAATLFLEQLEFHPTDAAWADRDRFVLSGGHGSMLLYSLLHLFGYDVSIEDLKNFRQLGSKTPGHPEFGHTHGVETTTGPLAQGCGNAVGMAIAEKMLAERFNLADADVVDHFTYVMCGDGDLMEGLSHEVFSMAGHLALEKLIVFYDSNNITIEGKRNISETDDVVKRFKAYNFQVIEIDAHDFGQIKAAIKKAKNKKTQPSIIICHSHIGFGSPNLHDTHGVHGAPLGDEELKLTKANLGFPEDKFFYVPEEVYDVCNARLRALRTRMRKWHKKFNQYISDNPAKAALWKTYFEAELPNNLEEFLPKFDKPTATRVASGKVIQGMAEAIPNLVGGSADLAPSTKTLIDNGGDINTGEFAGRNFHFGIREHGMGAVMNGISLHGGFRIFGSTFFVFSDYCRPTIRLAGIMGIPVIYVFTHDSFYVGEDGPTHQPIEHIAALRCIPNVTVIRPGDPTETGAAWIAALKNKTGPSVILLTRQDLNVIDREDMPAASSLERGAYSLWQKDPYKAPEIIFIATGSEVNDALDAAKLIKANVRVVSMPSWELFEKQTHQYKDSVFPPSCTKRVVIEAGSKMGWEKYAGLNSKFICMDEFGASGPYKLLKDKYGYTPEKISEVASELL
ncbi:MAG: transketolase [Kiritimatiellae bacterium]|jgi:transketolase|nr:transketolase [Kiritimatiellia bacterium]